MLFFVFLLLAGSRFCGDTERLLHILEQDVVRFLLQQLAEVLRQDNLPFLHGIEELFTLGETVIHTELIQIGRIDLQRAAFKGFDHLELPFFCRFLTALLQDTVDAGTRPGCRHEVQPFRLRGLRTGSQDLHLVAACQLMA